MYGGELLVSRRRRAKRIERRSVFAMQRLTPVTKASKGATLECLQHACTSAMKRTTAVESVRSVRRLSTLAGHGLSLKL